MQQIIKVGDIVRVKTFEQIANEQNQSSNRSYVDIHDDNECFTDTMRKFSGRIFRVNTIDTRVNMNGKSTTFIDIMDGYNITPSMIEIMELNLEQESELND